MQMRLLATMRVYYLQRKQPAMLQAMRQLLLVMQRMLAWQLLAAPAAVLQQLGALQCTSTLSAPAAPAWQRVCRSR
jgi:hypothetical protein